MMFACVQRSLKTGRLPCVQHRGRGEVSEGAEPDEEEEGTAFRTERAMRALIHAYEN